MQEVARVQEAKIASERRIARRSAPDMGQPGSKKRLEAIAVLAASMWVGLMLFPLRWGDGLTLEYFLQMTLLVGAFAIAAVVVPDRTLWRSRPRRLGVGGGTYIAWSLAGLLYLAAVVALFQFIELFW